MDEQEPKLPEITPDDLQLFHDNPNTSDIVDRVRELQLQAVKEDRERMAVLALQRSAMFPSDSDYTRGYALARQNIAVAIRNAPLPKE